MPGPEPSPPLGRIWEYRGHAPIATAVAVAGGLVFVTDTAGTIAALELATGEIRWTWKLADGPLSSPTATLGAVFVGTPNSVIALDALDGSPRWTSAMDGPVDGAPIVTGTMVVVGSEAGTVEAVDAVTGRSLWRASTGAPVNRSLAVSGELLYVPVQGGTVVALDIADGSTAWRTSIGIAGGVGTAVADDGLVYVSAGLDTGAGARREIVALSAEDGAVEWTYTSPAGSFEYSPAIADGLAIVVGEDSLVVALDATTGAQRWVFKTQGPDEAVAAAVGQTVVIADDDHVLYGLDLATGALRWQAAFTGVPYGPTIVDGLILVPTTLGVVDAIGAQR